MQGAGDEHVVVKARIADVLAGEKIHKKRPSKAFMWIESHLKWGMWWMRRNMEALDGSDITHEERTTSISFREI